MQKLKATWFRFILLLLTLSSVPAHGLSPVPAWFSAEALGVAEDGESYNEWLGALACREATRAQLSQVEQGNRKKDLFLRYCAEKTNNSSWCNQLARPNPDSIATFRCTYGSAQPHQLIHPTEKTWDYAVRAVKLVEQLNAKGIRVCEIYNWWRPEPYNKNVGGAAGRHPYGTSVDIRFCSVKEAQRGFDSLCANRKRGEIRALGYYGNSGVHLGVADATANTWGRACK